MRGLSVLLAQMTASGDCLFTAPDDPAKRVQSIDGADVSVLSPMPMWWNSGDIWSEFAKATKTIACAELFATNEDYFRKVISRVPDATCPNPHIVLKEYVEYA